MINNKVITAVITIQWKITAVCRVAELALLALSRMQPSPRLFPLENERGGKTRKARIVYDTGQNNFQLVVILLACIVREYVSIAACLKSF